MAGRKKNGSRGGRREGAGRKPILRDAVSLTLYVEADQIDRLREIAAREGTTVAPLVRKAVAAFLARQRK